MNYFILTALLLAIIFIHNVEVGLELCSKHDLISDL
jgi:hypothetical protein